MTAIVPASAPVESTPVEAASRLPLLRLFLPAALWLLVGSLLAFLHSVQAVSPEFLARCHVLNYGRAGALAETALVYGWLGNAGLGLALWILVRLGGQPLRAANWTLVGSCFWNLGVLLGLIGIATGDATGFALLEFPRYVQPLLLAAYAAVGVGGVLAWSGRRRQFMFASQWYGAAALFLLPWLLSAAQVMLLWFPVRGAVQPVVAAWYGQGVWSLWLAPLALAVAYYLVAKITARPIAAYELAPAGFWCLVFVAPFTAGRHLIGGPVPAWIGSIGVVASATLLFHYAVVALNFKPGCLLFRARLPETVSRDDRAALRFVAIGLAAYLWGGLFDAITSVRAVAERLQFTWVDEAQRQLAFGGAASLILLGGLYYALPRLAGRPLFSPGLRCAHLAAAAAGLLLTVFGQAAAGWAQSADLADPHAAFSTIFADTHGGLSAAVLGQGLVLLGGLFLVINVFKTAACPFYKGQVERSRGGAAR